MAETSGARRRDRLSHLGASVLLLFALIPAHGSAQTFQVIHSFLLGIETPNGPLVQGPDGDLYGTTSGGFQFGDNGFIFKIDSSGVVTVLHRFSDSEGSPPSGLLLGTDGNFYGMTGNSPYGFFGTVFRYSPGGTLTTLHFFSPGEDGDSPTELVEGPDGNFYGTASGGPTQYGTFFRITPSGTFTTIRYFSDQDNQQRPGRLVLGSDGNFYGTTSYSGYGSIARITPGGEVTTLYSFGGFDGRSPVGRLVEGADGSFYGVTSDGGPGGVGTIFKVTPTGTFALIYSLYWTGPNRPQAGLVRGNDGNFYGTTTEAGLNNLDGSIFGISPSGGFTLLHEFAGPDGSVPIQNLIQGTDGGYYGVTSRGGVYGAGTAFRIDSSGSFNLLCSFRGTEGGGLNPSARLLPTADGNLLGTTTFGGVFGEGTIFVTTSIGAVTVVHDFWGGDGSRPSAALTRGVDGYFYGTTTAGGALGFGTVFRVTATGALTTLHSFTGAGGAFPLSAAVQAPNGDFYGTAYEGGQSSHGTIFKISPSGLFTPLYQFSGADGSNPEGDLILDGSGNLLGTTYSGGTANAGTVFKLGQSGTLQTLFSFGGNGGMNPSSGLVAGLDGNYYGATQGGGPGDSGTIFRISPSGDMTTVYAFTTQGTPNSLTLSTDGSLYGTTSPAGPAGSLFQITTQGVLTSLHTFSWLDGSNPNGLSIGTDGNIYGTTRNGGAGTYGAIFKLDPLGPPAPTASVSGDAGVCVGGSTTIQAALTGAPPWTLTWSDGLVQNGIAASPVTRVVSPTSTFVYTVLTVSDANMSGLSSGSARVLVKHPLSSSTISPGGPLAYCDDGRNQAYLALVEIGGGIVTRQWGYRTIPGGAISQFPGETAPFIYLSSSRFAAPGIYYIVVTSTPQCGVQMISNEVMITVSTTPVQPVITAPSAVGAGSPKRTASVLPHAGLAYLWGISNGTITEGPGTNQITFTAGSAGAPLQLSVAETNAWGCVSPVEYTQVQVLPAGNAVLFYTATPCRQLDTRSSAPIASHGTLTVALTGAPCGIPAGATSVSVNVAETEAGGLGHLRLYPADGALPQTSSLNFNAGQTRSSNAILKLSNDGTGSVAIYNGSGGTVHVIIDVNGYFQ